MKAVKPFGEVEFNHPVRFSIIGMGRITDVGSCSRVLAMDHGYRVNSLLLLPSVWSGGQHIVNDQEFLVKDPI